MFELKEVNILNKAGDFVFKEPINLTIEPSQIWMFKGSNGIGKTSVYESLIGLRSIHQGEIWFNNQRIDKLNPQDRIKLGVKFIAQQNSLFEDLTVRENLNICAEYLLPYNERKEKVEQALIAFSLTELADKYAGKLSGGQKRLAELSKILIGKAELVLIDEPFSAIDEFMISSLQNVFKKLKNENNMSFFINDHNSKALLAISDMQLAVTKNQININNLLC